MRGQWETIWPWVSWVGHNARIRGGCPTLADTGQSYPPHFAGLACRGHRDGDLQAVGREFLDQALTPVTQPSGAGSGSRSSISATRPSRYASTCTRPGPPLSGGWTRAMTNVGEVTGPRTSSPWPMPCTRVVLPAPSGPVSTIRSPALSTAATRWPSACMSAAVATGIRLAGAPAESWPDATENTCLLHVSAL